MPYLSRVLLNPARPQTRRLLTNPQQVKGAILGEFASQPVTERVLWRADYRTVAGRPSQAELLVLATSRPSWTGLIEQFGYPGDPDGEAQMRDYSPVLALVARGREFAFRVRVNPVQNTSNPEHPTESERRRLARNDRRSLRIAHRTVAAQIDWFMRRAAGWGFELPIGSSGAPDFRVAGREVLDFVKGPKGQHRVRIGTATFEGRLRVTDADRFTDILLAGIGPAKGYGCGLMTLARPHNVSF